MDHTAAGPASLRRRALAYILDALALGAVAGVLAGQRGRDGDRHALRTAALAGLLGTGYHVALEGATGQTIGKYLLGITVVREDGSACSYRAAGIRTVLRALDWLPISYAFGTASMVVSPSNQRIGDRVAGTVVVRADAVDGAGEQDDRSGGEA